MNPFMNDEIKQLEEEYMALAMKLSEARKNAEPIPLEGEFTFDSPDGPKSLLDLFGESEELLIIHNMGRGCDYCTLWGDTLASLYKHLTQRAPVVMISPDPVAVQQEFRSERGWPWQMFHEPGAFSTQVGYMEGRSMYPGCTAVARDGDRIFVTGQTPFGPGDQICGLWHLMDLLRDGQNGWQPGTGKTGD